MIKWFIIRLKRLESPISHHFIQKCQAAEQRKRFNFPRYMGFEALRFFHWKTQTAEMRYWLVQIEFIRICRPANSHIIRLLERTLAAGIIIFFENPPEEDVVVVVLQQSSWLLLLFSVWFTVDSCCCGWWWLAGAGGGCYIPCFLVFSWITINPLYGKKIYRWFEK